ncbi:MAG TPA: hypothetical protein VFI25_13970 [Planctomycetota bacterium]|jgi:hypothetical protein|nr:hypothetical protein [Planctomycetota bacterium]
MNTRLVPALVAGGVALGGAFVLALAPRSPAPPANGGTWKALEAQAEELRQLRSLLGELASRVETIELAPVSPREPAAPAVAERVAASIPPPAAAGDDLHAAVAAALREEREAERKQEENRRAEQRGQQLERRLDRLSETLALASAQKDSLRKLFQEDDERRRDVADRAARGEVDWTDPGVREEMRGYVEARQQRLQGILTPDQYEKYQESPEGRLTRVFAGGGPGGEGFMRFFGDRERRPRPRRQAEEEGTPAPGPPR